MTPINVVVDLSHFNTVSSFETVKNEGGIVGVIHKATQGTSMIDSKYHERKAAAAAAGLWWGAYHFGVGNEDGAAQAKFFLSVVEPGPNDLLVLDLEINPSGPGMTLAQAEEWVNYVQAETGRWPGVYGGSYITELLRAHPGETALGFCWFWLAEYGPTPHLPPAWKEWTMWQYTDGRDGLPPHTVPGIGACDRDKYNGDMDGLKKLWGYETADTTDSTAAPGGTDNAPPGTPPTQPS
ncbi:MAG TPA: glycoside hydrolase family 25 protein [Pyrinomonadaceae bacterium]|nr:glycoside hydrolase family 25 protein [Pyrinomonadaceae bacterium]